MVEETDLQSQVYGDGYATFVGAFDVAGDPRAEEGWG